MLHVSVSSLYRDAQCSRLSHSPLSFLHGSLLGGGGGRFPAAVDTDPHQHATPVHEEAGDVDDDQEDEEHDDDNSYDAPSADSWHLCSQILTCKKWHIIDRT